MGCVKLTTEQWIEKARAVHGDYYDYSKVIYTKSCNKVIIICPEHGEFNQVASSHSNQGTICPRCSIEDRVYRGGGKPPLAYTTESYREKLRELFGDKFDYSKTEYTGSGNRVTITCHEHGDISVISSNLLKGKAGCAQCHIESNRKTNEEFIREVREIHGDLYDYGKVNYTTRRKKVIIGCPYHGDVEVKAYDLLRGRGCVECGKESKWVGSHEKALFQPLMKEMLGEENVIFQYNFQQFYVDAYVPKLRLVIEFDEQHHFRKDNPQKDKDRQFLIETMNDVSFYRIKDRELATNGDRVRQELSQHIEQMVHKIAG